MLILPKGVVDVDLDMDLVPLPADGRAAGAARRVVRTRLEAWRLEDLIDVAVLLTSEVVANVIVHTASVPSLGLSRDHDGVRVTVVDGSPVPPLLRRHSRTAATGRGLQMLDRLADDWGWDPRGEGKAVWFLLQGTHEQWAGAARPDTRMVPTPAPETAPSPLGRYAASGDIPVGTVAVVLLGVPVRVLAAAREHHDGLMREFRLLALSDAPSGHDVPERLVELTRVLGGRFGTATARPDADFDRAVEQGMDTIDLVYRVPPTVADGARQLESLMREADEFCRSARLVTLPRPPVVARFARWYVGQFVDQLAGRPAVRWDGPLDPA